MLSWCLGLGCVCLYFSHGTLLTIFYDIPKTLLARAQALIQSIILRVLEMIFGVLWESEWKITHTPSFNDVSQYAA
jgi:hypothetical protein